jgi:hypothetical protein
MARLMTLPMAASFLAVTTHLRSTSRPSLKTWRTGALPAWTGKKADAEMVASNVFRFKGALFEFRYIENGFEQIGLLILKDGDIKWRKIRIEGKAD